MKYFISKTEVARYVTKELLPELEPGCMLTTITRRAKSGDFYVTFAITNSSAEIEIQKLTAGLDNT